MRKEKKRGDRTNLQNISQGEIGRIKNTHIKIRMYEGKHGSH